MPTSYKRSGGFADTRLGLIREAVSMQGPNVTIEDPILLKEAFKGDVTHSLRSVRHSTLIKVIKNIQHHRLDMVPSRSEMAQQIILEIKNMSEDLENW